jgi:hypothetical protein
MSPHYFFEQPPPSSTPRSRIDTKLYSVVTITELFPMARPEIILLKVQTVKSNYHVPLLFSRLTPHPLPPPVVR